MAISTTLYWLQISETSFLLSSRLTGDLSFSYTAKRGDNRRGCPQLLTSLTNLITVAAHAFSLLLVLHLCSGSHPLLVFISYSISVPYLSLLSADSLLSAFKQTHVLPIKNKQTKPLLCVLPLVICSLNLFS